ncbi:PLP-dependent aminotransferase family protein [Methylobacterium isbiliense]|jgi:DNA-binding transcriptional MocR family regulator|uniref:8-amino-7-oxononanoate synthase n=1 Tax=Methylobacterium isbiliense TaxID=315478 RepID=A0ABQ4SMH2_9HYPH|nr:PLP-dependent aminotransferase family protein [Methylobacterium isbiliense]MDN3623659.1 PLP-dependent aminotransferase family protein [Methylobacterium isbiliense]GJE03083.1 Histidinol-phosphate aminotransferase [Methylobacterium isbiliense]
MAGAGRAGQDKIAKGAAEAWAPDLKRWGRPRYLAIVDALAEDIRTGRLSPGTRLPTQRALAEVLALNFTTVSRGYVEAQKRGLIEGRVGQGTFVVDPARSARPAEAPRPGPVDFTMNLPPEPDQPALQARMQASFAELSGSLANLLRYQGFGGTEEDRDAATRWLAGRGVASQRERLLICPGAHSALFGVLGQVARPGDVVCAERITYPGIRALAAHLGLRLVDLPMDQHGVDPDAFAAACTRIAPKAIYLNPLLQNPTTATIPRSRREAIVAVARRYAVAIIEDDAYAQICPAPPPSFATLAPEITYYVAGLAKSLGAGLRLAFLVAPSARAALPLAGALRAMTVMASPIATALATRWITDGTAEAIVQFVRAESAARQRLAASLLPAGTYVADPHGFHAWIRLPEGWTRSAFASQGRAAGLGVVASDPFCVAGTPPEAVRLCLGGPSTRAQISHGLEILAHALEGSPALASTYI